MHKKPQQIRSIDVFRARQKIRSGEHMVVTKDGLVLGIRTDKLGVKYDSLTLARKAAKHGDAIVRVSDCIVVSVK